MHLWTSEAHQHERRDRTPEFLIKVGLETQQRSPTITGPTSSGDGTVYECKPCDQVFRRRGSLIQHLSSSAHLPEIKCKSCYRTFTSEGALLEHGKQSHPTRIECHHCQKMFISFSALYRHIDSVAALTPEVLNSCYIPRLHDRDEDDSSSSEHSLRSSRLATPEDASIVSTLGSIGTFTPAESSDSTEEVDWSSYGPDLAWNQARIEPEW